MRMTTCDDPDDDEWGHFYDWISFVHWGICVRRTDDVAWSCVVMGEPTYVASDDVIGFAGGKVMTGAFCRVSF